MKGACEDFNKRNLTMIKSKFLVLCGIAMVFYGCSKSFYQVGEIKYDSSEEALAAQAEDWNRTVSTIKPAQTMLPYPALIVLPTQKAIREHWIWTRGSPSDDVVNYIIQGQAMILDKTTEVIRRRRLFQEVSITRNDDPIRFRTPDYNVILFPVVGHKWFVKFSSRDEAIPILHDPALTSESTKWVSWLEYLERKVVQELGR